MSTLTDPGPMLTSDTRWGELNQWQMDGDDDLLFTQFVDSPSQCFGLPQNLEQIPWPSFDTGLSIGTELHLGSAQIQEALQLDIGSSIGTGPVPRIPSSSISVSPLKSTATPMTKRQTEFSCSAICPTTFSLSTSDSSPIEELPRGLCVPQSREENHSAGPRSAHTERIDRSSLRTGVGEHSLPHCSPPTTASPSNAQTFMSTKRRVSAGSSRKPRQTCTGSKARSEDEDSAKKQANRTHSLVERRYRERLNKKLEELGDSLRQVQLPLSSEETSRSSRTTSEGHSKRKKSDVLSDAMSYIHTSEVEMRHLTNEVTYLNERVKLLEKRVKCEDCPIVKQMGRVRLVS